MNDAAIHGDAVEQERGSQPPGLRASDPHRPTPCAVPDQIDAVHDRTMSDRPFTRSRTGRLGDTRKKLSSKAKPQARGTHPLLPR
jgi:hypothetical protein